MKNAIALIIAVCAAVLGPSAWATAPIGAAALQSRHATLAPQLANSPFGSPVHIESQEAARRIEGDVYAVLDHPFSKVSATLADPGQWCDILILHLNTKYCRKQDSAAGAQIDLRVGKKEEQSIESANLLRFAWRAQAQRPDYVLVAMNAPEGPYGTRDYQLVAEAVPLGDGRTFLHMAYGFSYGGASNVALHVYLATAARDKVGFTRVNGQWVGGVRGVVERNTVRYYFALRSYIDSLALAPAARAESRMRAWFDATEQHPQQLHELDREEYLRMKRNEVARQLAPG